MPKPRNPARTAATRAGKPHYQGNPCSKGHTLRHVRSGACVACQADAQRQRRAAAVSIESLLG